MFEKIYTKTPLKINWYGDELMTDPEDMKLKAEIDEIMESVDSIMKKVETVMPAKQDDVQPTGDGAAIS